MKYSASSDYTDLDKAKLPCHVAIIMDGNGRWAKKHLFNRLKGHAKGSEAVRTIVRAASDAGIPILTLYAFSTENWRRSKGEVAGLMTILGKFLKSEQKEMMENNIRLDAIGQTERLSKNIQHQLQETISLTKKNSGMLLNLALSYGGRAEIVRMVQLIAKEVKDGRIDYNSITPQLVSKHLYTKDIPDPDLLIRTSGEMRISNFLLWQIAYSEIYITDTLWPDFGRDEFIHILKDYTRRERRFGKVKT